MPLSWDSMVSLLSKYQLWNKWKWNCLLLIRMLANMYSDHVVSFLLKYWAERFLAYTLLKIRNTFDSEEQSWLLWDFLIIRKVSEYYDRLVYRSVCWLLLNCSRSDVTASFNIKAKETSEELIWPLFANEVKTVGEWIKSVDEVLKWSDMSSWES